MRSPPNPKARAVTGAGRRILPRASTVSLSSASVSPSLRESEQPIHSDECATSFKTETDDEIKFIYSGFDAPAASVEGQASTSDATEEENPSRVPNAFILFRTNLTKEHKLKLAAEGTKAPMEASISPLASTRWNSMSYEEKEPWYAENRKLQREFDIKYPNYQYTPGYRKAEKEARKNERKLRSMSRSKSKSKKPTLSPASRTASRTTQTASTSQTLVCPTYVPSVAQVPPVVVVQAPRPISEAAFETRVEPVLPVDPIPARDALPVKSATTPCAVDFIKKEEAFSPVLPFAEPLRSLAPSPDQGAFADMDSPATLPALRLTPDGRPSGIMPLSLPALPSFEARFGSTPPVADREIHQPQPRRPIGSSLLARLPSRGDDRPEPARRTLTGNERADRGYYGSRPSVTYDQHRAHIREFEQPARLSYEALDERALLSRWSLLRGADPRFVPGAGPRGPVYRDMSGPYAHVPISRNLAHRAGRNIYVPYPVPVPVVVSDNRHPSLNVLGLENMERSAAAARESLQQTAEQCVRRPMFTYGENDPVGPVVKIEAGEFDFVTEDPSNALGVNEPDPAQVRERRASGSFDVDDWLRPSSGSRSPPSASGHLALLPSPAPSEEPAGPTSRAPSPAQVDRAEVPLLPVSFGRKQRAVGGCFDRRMKH